LRALYYFCLIFILLFNSVFASVDQGIATLPSLEWQKQNLEDRIRTKVESVLNKIISNNGFAVDIEIAVNGSEDPEWNKTDDPLNADSKDPTKAQGDTAIDTPEAKKDEEIDPSKNGKVLFKDVEGPKTPEDFIVFTKFGIEAPLIEDFNDFQPDGKIIFSMDGGGADKKKEKDELVKKEKDLQNKMKDLSRATPVEQVWKYNNAIDVFNNLKSVVITVKMSQGLPDEAKQTAEKYVRAINFNLGKIKPTLNFEYGMLGNDFGQPSSLLDKVAAVLDYFSKFATFLGIIFGVLLAGFVGNGLIKKFFELNSGSQDSSSMTMESGDDSNDEEEDLANSLGGGGGVGEGISESSLLVNGIDRFQSYVKKSETDAVLIIKKWIREEDNKAKWALKALVQQMDNESLVAIFKRLTDIEKSSWKKLLDSPLNKAELDGANAFISNQIVQDIIVPKFINDPETFDMVIKLKPLDVVKIIQKDFEIGCTLLNAFSIGFINGVLDLCDEKLRERVVVFSVEITPDAIIGNQDKIKSAIEEFVHVEKPRPFVDVIRQLIPDANPDYENVLFDSLFKVATRDEMNKIVFENFPASLLFELPNNFLKSTLSAYPLKKKVKMLMSVESDIKQQLLEIFAPEGSKAFDLINLEFEDLEKDEFELANVKNSSSENWKDFIHYTRSQISSDKQFTNQIKEILNRWLDSKGSGTNSSNERHLKVA